jgi:cellobiose-specific phosphotransferase system component IIC
MNAITFRDLAGEMVDLYEKLYASGSLKTESWRGAVVAIVCAIVAFLIWYPFMKRFDLKTYKKKQSKTLTLN